jgi:hypothetical protein
MLCKGSLLKHLATAQSDPAAPLRWRWCDISCPMMESTSGFGNSLISGAVIMTRPCSMAKALTLHRSLVRANEI